MVDIVCWLKVELLLGELGLLVCAVLCCAMMRLGGFGDGGGVLGLVQVGPWPLADVGKGVRSL